MDGHQVKVLTVITYIKFKNLPDSITIFFFHLSHSFGFYLFQMKIKLFWILLIILGALQAKSSIYTHLHILPVNTYQIYRFIINDLSWQCASKIYCSSSIHLLCALDWNKCLLVVNPGCVKKGKQMIYSLKLYNMCLNYII